MNREKFILENFELSREIGFRHFLAENFNRDDPALTKLNPEERKAFLREWWDGARDRMFQEYCAQVSALSFLDLLDRRQDYMEMLDAIGMLEWREGKAKGGSELEHAQMKAVNTDRLSLQQLRAEIPPERKQEENSRTRDKNRER